jgi:hypothetical protein
MMNSDESMPYSHINPTGFSELSAKAGIPVNPPKFNKGISQFSADGLSQKGLILYPLCNAR